MTAIDQTTTIDLTGMQHKLVSRLERFRGQVRRHMVLEGAVRVLLEAIGLVLVSYLLDRWLRLSVPMRIIFAIASISLLSYEFWWQVIEPLRVKLSLVGLAAAIDRKHSGTDGLLAGRVASVLELPNLLYSSSPPSPAMVERAVLDCDESLRPIRFEGFLDENRSILVLLGIVSLLSLSVLTAMVSPHTTGLWLRRWFAASSENWPQSTHLRIAGLVDGKLIIPKGESFTLRVLNGEGSVAPKDVSMRYREGSADRVSVVMNRFAPGDYRYEFPSLQATAEVEVSGGDDTVGPFKIEPVERPKLLELQLVTQHPTEPQPTTHGFTGQELDLSFLPKTKMELTFATSVPVREVRMKSSVASPSSAQLRRVDDRHYALPWTHESAVQLQIELVGEADLASHPTPLAIGLKQDQPPRISLTYTGVRQRVTPQATIPLVLAARDDYGVAQIDLSVKAELIDLTKVTGTTSPTTGPTTNVSLAEAINKTLYSPTTKPSELEVSLTPTLEVSALKLVPGSLLSVSAAAMDGCYLGPQTSKSRLVTFRIVPPEELFKEILLRQQGERMKFRKLIEAAQKIRTELNAATSPEILASLTREHRLIQREVARTSSSLTESVTEMKLNALGGQEAWDLMDKKILGPLKTLHDQTMNQQRDTIDALRGGDAPAIAIAAQQQDQIITTMQEILKQMAQWDSFVDVVNQLNEIIRLEIRVKQSAEQMKKKQSDGVFDP